MAFKCLSENVFLCMKKLIRLLTAGALLLALVWPRAAVRIGLSESSCYLPAERFMLQWRHSVEHQLWREYYRSDGQSLHLERTEMQTFGAGTPAGGQTVTTEKGFVGFKSSVRLPELNWVVSRNMQGEIRTLQSAWPLYAQVPDYSTIRITPAYLAQMVVWLGACDD